jgi:hypothetical protein
MYLRQRGFIMTFGPQPSIGYEKKKLTVHTNEIFDESEKYQFILPIRNPYTRVVSQWKYHCMTCGDIKFEEWFWKYSRITIMLPVARLYKYDRIIKTENITEELKNLNLYYEAFPTVNKSRDDLGHSLSEKEKELIYYLHYEDFIAGNYEK